MTYEECLKEIASRNPDLVVMTAENRVAIRNLPQFLGARFIDVGIAEQTMIGMAAGLALRGRIPIVHALATFLTLRAFEFIRNDIGVPSLSVKLVGSIAGFLSDANGPTHQAIDDIAVMRVIPQMRIVCPADEEELVQALPKIVESPFPYYIRHNGMKPTVRHTGEFEIGKAEVLSEGADVSILVHGFLLTQAAKAAEILDGKKISVRLINVRTLKPIDKEAILKAARETGLVVTLEDHFLTGGLYTIVAELLLEHQVTCNVLPIALQNRWFKPVLLDDLLRYEGFTGKQIAEKILKCVEHFAPAEASEKKM